MEGLEVNILKLSEVFLDNEKFRIDSEFFLKKFLDAYKTIKGVPNTTIGKITKTLSDFSANGSYASIAKNFTLLDEVDYAYMGQEYRFRKIRFCKGCKIC